MIDIKFKSKRPVPVTSYQQSNWPVVHQQGSFYKAKKLGITLDEYEDRVKIVAAAAKASRWHVGQLGYPHDKESYDEHGPCRVVAIVTHYDQYGTVEWNDPPYILAVRPEKQPNNVVNCTHGWIVEKPKYELEKVC